MIREIVHCADDEQLLHRITTVIAKAISCDGVWFNSLDLRTGRVTATLQGRDDGGTADAAAGAPLTLVGDALYVPYGVRSVYSVDVRAL